VTEHEKRLRAMISEANHGSGATGEYNLALTLTYLDTALSAARDAALEEAATQIQCGCGLDACRQNLGPERIRALKAHPAVRYLPEAKVRGAAGAILAGVGSDDYERGVERGVRMLCGAIGVDLDAAPAKVAAINRNDVHDND
jgi:hypothetical protein